MKSAESSSTLTLPSLFVSSAEKILLILELSEDDDVDDDGRSGDFRDRLDQFDERFELELLFDPFDGVELF